MEWIRVKDKKPEDDQTVFVINNKVHMLATKAYYFKEMNEFMNVETVGNLPISVTHWMPYPKPPKN